MPHPLRDTAERFRSSCSRSLRVALTYDRASLELVTAYLERLRVDREMQPIGVPAGMQAAAAAFLGQCLIAAHGGEWVEVDAEWMVRLSNGSVAQPADAVRNHLTRGLRHSILGYYDAVDQVLRADAEWDLAALTADPMLPG
jgi:hypothetical protein